MKQFTIIAAICLLALSQTATASSLAPIAPSKKSQIDLSSEITEVVASQKQTWKQVRQPDLEMPALSAADKVFTHDAEQVSAPSSGIPSMAEANLTPTALPELPPELAEELAEESALDLAQTR